MSDLRKALQEAGLVSEKQIRQAKHQERVERKDLGQEGLAAQRRQREAEQLAELAQKREADRQRNEARLEEKAAEGGRGRVTSLLREESLIEREAGPKRFYFALPDGRITFLEVSPGLARRLTQGDAAIVDAAGVIKAGFTAVSGKAAVELERLDRKRILMWNARR